MQRDLVFEIASHLKKHGAPLMSISQIVATDTVVRFTATSLVTPTDVGQFAVHVYPKAGP